VLPSINDALLEMNDAHNILLKEAQTERNAAAYKVARRYLSFYNARKNELTDNGKLLLKRNSSQILSYLEQLPLDERMDLTVANCKESLEIVIRELSVI
jgi:hypothetical protein